MVDQPRMSAQTLKVLAALMSSSKDGLSGAQVAREAKLASGTLYPILLRLEQAKWLESWWEDEDPSILGRPRRRFYRVTALGAKNTKAVFRELAPAFGGLAWS
jgi:DNA-binding PadR family transcriptional regulator